MTKDQGATAASGTVLDRAEGSCPIQVEAVSARVRPKACKAELEGPEYSPVHTITGLLYLPDNISNQIILEIHKPVAA